MFWYAFKKVSMHAPIAASTPRLLDKVPYLTHSILFAKHLPASGARYWLSNRTGSKMGVLGTSGSAQRKLSFPLTKEKTR